MVPSKGGAGTQLAVLSGTPRQAPRMSCTAWQGLLVAHALADRLSLAVAHR